MKKNELLWNLIIYDKIKDKVLLLYNYMGFINLKNKKSFFYFPSLP
jgi:hypothetical protein